MFKKSLKFAFFALFALLVFYIGAEAGFQIKYWLLKWKNVRTLEAFNKAVINDMKGDQYGGKTPEQTFDMFVSALKSENVELAVNFFILDKEKRLAYYKKFENLREAGQLKSYAENLPSWSSWQRIEDNYNNWTSQAAIEYGQNIENAVKIYDPWLKKETVIEPGIYGRSMSFVKNMNNIWKISSF